MENLNLKFEQLPNNWAVCFIEGCPVKEQCLRHLAAAAVPETQTYGNSVWPNALKNGECSMFAEVKYDKLAGGFSQLFSNLRQQDYKVIRRRMEDRFRRDYYRYMHGDKLLNPDQQQWIRQLFTQYGYTEDLVFDHYEMRINFPSNLDKKLRSNCSKTADKEQ